MRNVSPAGRRAIASTRSDSIPGHEGVGDSVIKFLFPLPADIIYDIMDSKPQTAGDTRGRFSGSYAARHSLAGYRVFDPCARRNSSRARRLESRVKA